jgi:tetratricopeptide (TPR) repeat protein
MSESSHRNSGALSAAERDALQAMFDRLSGSYYEVLGVARDCDRAALRGAYFDQLERFSSERFEGRDLGGYTLHIEAIAREINMAFAVLGEPDRRARYDRRLALSSDLRGVDEPVRDTRTPMPMTQRTNPKTPPPMYGRELRTSPIQGRDVPNPPPAIARDVRTPMPVMARHAPPAAPAVQSPPPPRSVVPPAPDHHAPPSRRPSQPPPPRQPSHPPPPPGNGALPSGMALESLGRLRAENRTREVQRSLEDLEALIEKAARNDDHAEIVRLLRHAITLRPDEPSWRTRLARAEETLQDYEVQRFANAARNAEKAQRWDTAGELWAKIADLRPTDAQAALHAAQALCEAAQDFARSAEYAKRAARIAPDMIAAHICLTRVFFKAGRTASARSALEQAAKLDPRHADVVALGQKLRG